MRGRPSFCSRPKWQKALRETENRNKAVDLQEKDSDDQDGWRASPSSGDGTGQVSAYEVRARPGERTARQLPADQRQESAGRPGHGNQDRRPDGADPAVDWRAAHHFDNYRGCGARTALESRRYRRGADQVHRSDDPARISWRFAGPARDGPRTAHQSNFTPN